MVDKSTILQIFGSLMKHPQYLSESDKYSLTPDDFFYRFDKYIFIAIDSLYRNGATRIDAIDVENYLSTNAAAKVIFKQQNGIEFLQDAETLTQPDNFPYYYKKLKKFNLLNSLTNKGIDISEFYIEDLTSPKAADVNAKFESLDVNDIVNIIKKKVLGIEKTYVQNNDVESWNLADEIDDIISHFGEIGQIGKSINGEIISEIINGAELGALTIRSAASGLGKALPNSTKIPTPNGWKRVDEIKNGDYLFDAFGKPTKVLGVFPQGEKEVWQLTFKDGRTAKCCSEHLWSYCTYNQRKESKNNRQFYVSTTNELLNKSLQNDKGTYQILIPQQYAVEYKTNIHYIPSYIFGLILGDGSFREHPTNKAFQYSSENTELPNKIAQTMNWILKRNSENNYTWYFANEKGNIHVNHVLKEYPQLINTYSQDKFIPREYLEDSIENRLDLLNGLLDSDGSVDIKGRISFFTISPLLRDNVIELAQSLGFKTRVIIDRHKKTSIGYMILITGRPEDKIKLFKLARKKERIINWYNSQKRKENNNFNPIIEIKNLHYSELMTCFLVDNKEHLFLTENFIVTHNTRLAVADVCKLAYPFYYDIEQDKWIKNGHSEQVLFIMTEQTKEQVMRMVLAYLTGIEDSKLRFNKLTDRERFRVSQAQEMIHCYSNNLQLMRIPDPSVEQIKLAVREKVITTGASYVFFDYVFVSPGLLQEFRGSNLRNDEALLLMATALKDLAIEQNISVFTSTQVNAKVDDNTNIRNEASLAGGRSTINKADNGIIVARPTKEELDFLGQELIPKCGGVAPNIVSDVFKVRSGRWTQVRVWSYFDAGNLRLKDLFVTDSRFNIINMFDDSNILEWELNDEDLQFLNKLNSERK